MLNKNHLKLLCGLVLGWAGCLAVAPTTSTATPATGGSVETIVIFRHGEKPPGGFGQITPQGFNRALSLATLLPQKFGKPDFLFAPDPGEELKDAAGPFNYARPLATIEPIAIEFGMPVHTPVGYSHIQELEDELTRNPAYANATVFVAWEHLYAEKLAVNLIKRFGGDTTAIPRWKDPDYDSLYIVKIARSPDRKPRAVFTLDHEQLDHLSKEMPKPAGG